MAPPSGDRAAVSVRSHMNSAEPAPGYNPPVDPRVNFITPAVADLAASRAFYVDGLGWTPSFEVPGEVVFTSLSPTLNLSQWSAAEFTATVRPIGEVQPADTRVVAFVSYGLVEELPKAHRKLEVDSVLVDFRHA